ncbi:hypothetical protein G7Y89_g13586 [Cudoniella acicularis]|uniref:Uncharacterized protein n=1 Tax=Cudoniella acicularis TaxID=354080 RepID=A0A8H4VVX3_9HELO|nr:hypothetical protein G7Y89_g13586 [Cudoniella acicularis]
MLLRRKPVLVVATEPKKPDIMCILFKNGADHTRPPTIYGNPNIFIGEVALLEALHSGCLTTARVFVDAGVRTYYFREQVKVTLSSVEEIVEEAKQFSTQELFEQLSAKRLIAS